MNNPQKLNNRFGKFQMEIIIRITLLSIIGFLASSWAAAIALYGVSGIAIRPTVLKIIPSESTGLASRADQIFFSNPKFPPREVEALARKALEQQAINAKALRVLGYYYDAMGDAALAEKYVRMAAKLSRREPGAQLWLVEASARKGDVVQTLVHYDIALRTKPDTQKILFPRLLAAIEDREIRVALKPYIRTDNHWVSDFLFFANNESKNLPYLVDLIVESGGLVDSDISRKQELELLNRLVSESFFVEARKLFLQMPGAKPERMTSAGFDVSDLDARFGPIGWQLFDDSDAGGEFVATTGGNQTRLSLFTNAATTRSVARKLLYLRPGSYMFSASLFNYDRGEGGFLRWQLRCPAMEGATVWTIDSITTSLRAKLTVPVNCPVQFLDLIASGGMGQTGLEATVSSIAISPAL